MDLQMFYKSIPVQPSSVQSIDTNRMERALSIEYNQVLDFNHSMKLVFKDSADGRFRIGELDRAFLSMGHC